MKITAPLYYKDFKCIADKCRHSCCIGWEIDIDSDTEERYSSLSDGYGKTVTESIDYSCTPHFKLGEDERCPHLAPNGLCRIICELGEDYLCDICREHPRFYNRTPRGFEVGLGMACEEACRIILSSKNYFEIYTVEDDGEEWEYDGFDSTHYRNKLISIIADKSIPYGMRIWEIYNIYEFLPISEYAFKRTLKSLEYLNPAHKDLFLSLSPQTLTAEREKYLERAMAYFVYRHCTEVKDYDDLRASVGFCLFCEKLLASLDGDIFDTARIVSEELEYSEENTEIIKNIFNE